MLLLGRMLRLFGLLPTLLLWRGQLVDGGGRLLVPRLLQLLVPDRLLLVAAADRVPIPVISAQEGSEDCFNCCQCEPGERSHFWDWSLASNFQSSRNSGQFFNGTRLKR